MVIFDLITNFIRRLVITDEELDSIRIKSSKTQNKSENSGNILVSSLRTYMNMYFDDFFQVRGFTDIEYREVLNKIANEIKKTPDSVEFQIENLKQFNSFSKAMQKAIFKVVKGEDQ